MLEYQVWSFFKKEDEEKMRKKPSWKEGIPHEMMNQLHVLSIIVSRSSKLILNEVLSDSKTHD